MSQKWFSLIVEMTLLQKKETFTKQSHCAPLWSIFALSRSKGQISDWVLFHLKEKNKAWDKSAGQTGYFQITKFCSLFGFLESCGFSTVASFAKFHSRKISASLTIISGPSFTSTYQVWGILQVPAPAHSVPSFFFSPFHGFKNHLGCPQMNRSGPDHLPPGTEKNTYW